MTDEEKSDLCRLEEKVDLLIHNQGRILGVLFDDSGNPGMTSRLADLCKTVAKHGTQLVRIWIAIGLLTAATLGADKILSIVQAAAKGG